MQQHTISFPCRFVRNNLSRWFPGQFPPFSSYLTHVLFTLTKSFSVTTCAFTLVLLSRKALLPSIWLIPTQEFRLLWWCISFLYPSPPYYFHLWSKVGLSLTHVSLVLGRKQLCVLIKICLLPGQVTQLVGVSSGEPKDCRFNPWSKHIPRSWFRSLVGARTGGNWLMFLSHIHVSLSPSLPLSEINKYILGED